MCIMILYAPVNGRDDDIDDNFLYIPILRTPLALDNSIIAVPAHYVGACGREQKQGKSAVLQLHSSRYQLSRVSRLCLRRIS